MRAGASPRFATRPCRNSRTPTAARTHIALRFGAPAEHRRGIVEPHRRIARFAMRPCRRNRRTPTTVQAHIALRTVTRSPVSPPNTAAESAERTNAPINAHGRIAPLCHAAMPKQTAAAGERRQPLERTSRCAPRRALALPQNTAAESAERTGASPRFATRPCRNRPPRQANADRLERTHIALRAATRSPVSPPNTAAESANRTDASPALPCGHAAATGEHRPARVNAAFDMRTDASPASPRGQVETDRRGRRKPTDWHKQARLSTPPGRATSVSPRGHAAAAGERRQSLERTSRCALALPCLPAEHRSGIGGTAFAGDESAPFEMRMDAHTACLAVFSAPGKFEHLPNMRL